LTSSEIKMTEDFISILQNSVRDHPFWERYLDGLSEDNSPYSIHLAVLVEPYLRFILEGRKTIESRFSLKRIAPFDRVKKGDVILLKRSSGPIVGLCLVQSGWFYRLDPSSWSEIRTKFAAALCAEDPSFWEIRGRASYATLMRIANVQELPAIEFPKRDRRGWVVLQSRTLQAELPISSIVDEKSNN